MTFHGARPRPEHMRNLRKGRGVPQIEVSKHPEASIPVTDMSLADIKRRRSHPAMWIVLMVLVLAAVIGPYWYGRHCAVAYTQQLISLFSMVQPRAVAMLSWDATVLGFIGLGMTVLDRHKIPWFVLFLCGLVTEQFMAGISMLKFHFWGSTYVMYGQASNVPDAANLGIIAAVMGLAVFAVLWIGLLIAVKKNSPLNVLARTWVSFLFYMIIEVAALCVVLFGGFIPRL
ncbi:hypothetical protein BMAGN_0216 [Bifidobacterium magnum]|uniref:Teichoic acid transporter n=2 Tax=Bifidobacterium magnum TaxID=1692 RepID=A0A087BB65_9BIFI|nr:hypothetical protein BMAGN_0216 [Bifidobacterium magnum]